MTTGAPGDRGPSAGPVVWITSKFVTEMLLSRLNALGGLMAIDPLLEKVEGVRMVGNHIVLTYDNDFNVAEVASSPANPNPEGPLVQLELVGANFPRIYVIPLP